MYFPASIGVLGAWFAGLMFDGVVGLHLGQSALAFSFVAYICVLAHRRWRQFSLLQQSFLVGGLIGFSQLVGYWVGNIMGDHLILLNWLKPVLLSFVFWPFLQFFLHRMNFSRRFGSYL